MIKKENEFKLFSPNNKRIKNNPNGGDGHNSLQSQL